MVRKHVGPFFDRQSLVRVSSEQISAFLMVKKREGLATKTITNQLAFLHGLFAYATKRGWIDSNPVSSVDRPRPQGVDPDIRYLDLPQLDALLRAVPDDALGPTERALYLAAAMTGLRQGELIALRWLDVDWPSERLRVRRNYTRQEFGTPKSRRASRSVPLASRVSDELKHHFEGSSYRADQDLVFAHPHTGHPLDASKLRKRFKQALQRARVRLVRFHDVAHASGVDGPPRFQNYADLRRLRAESS